MECVDKIPIHSDLNSVWMSEILRCPECGLTATLADSKVTYESRPCPVAGHPLMCEHMVKVVTKALKAADRLKQGE